MNEVVRTVSRDELRRNREELRRVRERLEEYEGILGRVVKESKSSEELLVVEEWVEYFELTSWLFRLGVGIR